MSDTRNKLGNRAVGSGRLIRVPAWVIFIGCWWLSVTCAAANPAVAGVEDDGRPFQINWRSWYSRGDHGWQVNTFDFDPTFGFADERTRVTWEDEDIWVHQIQGSYVILPWLRFHGAYGFGDIRDGDQTETNWISDAEVRDFMLARSVAATRGDVTLYQLGAALRLDELMRWPDWVGEWEWGLGYRYHEETLNAREGVLVVDLEEFVEIPFDGLDSEYSFQWQAFHAGLQGRVGIWPRVVVVLRVDGLFAMDYRGSGVDSLRLDARERAPNLQHSARNGVGLEGYVGVELQLTSALYVEAGYHHFRIRARNGSSRIRLADGETERADLDWVESRRTGFYLGIGGRF